VLAWGLRTAPTLALAAIGLLARSRLTFPDGTAAPVLVALTMQLAQMLPAAGRRTPRPARVCLHRLNGLFTSPAQLGPLLVSIGVSLGWAAVATVLAYLLFLRRDFTNVTTTGRGRRAITAGALPLVALVGVTIAIVAVSTPAMGSGLPGPRCKAVVGQLRSGHRASDT